jgi:hypothetical protein
MKYCDLVANPVATVREIHKKIDSPLTPVAAERMQRLASKRSRYCRLRAAEDLPDVWLRMATEARLFESYCARFGLPGSVPEMRQ